MQDEAPDWVRDGIRQFSDEVRLFARTAVDFSVRPFRFATEWASGRRHALNPLGFLATAFAIAGPANAIFVHFVREADRASSLWRDALAALTPFVYYLALGSIQHAVLRLCGSRRRLRDSCAMALYAGGGPAMITHLLVLVAAYLLWRSTGQLVAADLHSRWAVGVMVAAMLSFTLFCTMLSAALAGLHKRDGIRSYHIVAANCVAFLVTGCLFALLDPPGNFGLHFVFGPARASDGWHLRFGLFD